MRERAGRLHRIGLGTEWSVHVSEQAGIDLRLYRARLAGSEQLDLVAPAALREHALPHVVVLLGRVDGRQRAGLPELDVVPQVQLHLLEKLEAAHREVRAEVGDVAPAGRADLSGVDAGRLGSDLTAFDERDVAAQSREIQGGGRSRDATADYQCLRFGHSTVSLRVVQSALPLGEGAEQVALAGRDVQGGQILVAEGAVGRLIDVERVGLDHLS